jgi:hypothetical protein
VIDERLRGAVEHRERLDGLRRPGDLEAHRGAGGDVIERRAIQRREGGDLGVPVRDVAVAKLQRDVGRGVGEAAGDALEAERGELGDRDADGLVIAAGDVGIAGAVIAGRGLGAEQLAGVLGGGGVDRPGGAADRRVGVSPARLVHRVVLGERLRREAERPVGGGGVDGAVGRGDEDVLGDLVARARLGGIAADGEDAGGSDRRGGVADLRAARGEEEERGEAGEAGAHQKSRSTTISTYGRSTNVTSASLPSMQAGHSDGEATASGGVTCRA